VLQAFSQYQLHPLFTEDTSDFAAFCDSEAVRGALGGFAWSPNQVGRTLGVLADLGLIAQVSILRRDLLTNSDTFHKAFRPLREDERIRLADIATLKRISRSGEVSDVAYHFRAFLDRETSERAGAGGMFQIISLEDDYGNSRSEWIDHAYHYSDLGELRDQLAERLGVSSNLVTVEEIL
jgi:type I restriction enzyme S subunit